MTGVKSFLPQLQRQDWIQLVFNKKKNLIIKVTKHFLNIFNYLVHIFVSIHNVQLVSYHSY